METESRVLIILGMHRSGTSLVADWLDRCGLNLGDRLLGTGPGNINGHFEDLDFVHTHEEILKSNGITFGALECVENLDISPYQKAKMKSIVSLKNELRHEWGWKEPRTCLLSDIYLELIPNAFLLILYRPMKEVVSSLLRREFRLQKTKRKKYSRKEKIKYAFFESAYREKFSTENSERFAQAWITYNRKLLDVAKSTQNFLVVDYKQLITDWEKVHYCLTSRGFHLKPIDFKVVYNSKLMHSSTELKFLRETLSEAKNIEQSMLDLVNKSLHSN